MNTGTTVSQENDNVKDRQERKRKRNNGSNTVICISCPKKSSEEISLVNPLELFWYMF